MKASIVIMTALALAAAASALVCDEILEQPADKKVTLQELHTVPPKELIQCLAHLGKEQMPTEEADYIWRTIVEYYEGVPNVPEKVLMLLHWVTPAVTPDEYANITLSSIEVVENFGLNYNLNNDQLASIAQKVREDFAGKEPEDYTYYDLTALRQILCAFNRSEIERIRPAAYREAAVLIGKLDQCPPEVLAGFAVLAVQKSAFGSPARWGDAITDILGAVADHVPKDVNARNMQSHQSTS